MGGHALAVFGARAELANCILWGQTSESSSLIALQGTDERDAELIVSYCDVKNGADGIVKTGSAVVTWGAGNLNQDPRFQDPAGADAVAGTEDDNLRLRSGSPCIDAGDNTAVPTDADDLDLDQDRVERQARFVDDTATADTGVADLPAYRSIVDIGAYEFRR
ncbi:MAG: hypothetical protein ACYTAO_05960 [Planctomycetota bacterium]